MGRTLNSIANLRGTFSDLAEFNSGILSKDGWPGVSFWDTNAAVGAKRALLKYADKELVLIRQDDAGTIVDYPFAIDPNGRMNVAFGGLLGPWTTAQRPASANGVFGYNSTLGAMEAYTAQTGLWQPLAPKPRNRVINSGMEIAQRGTVAAGAATASYGGPDRFISYMDGTPTVHTLSRAFGYGGGACPITNYGMMRTITRTGGTLVDLSTYLESKDTYDLTRRGAGGTLGVVSARAKVWHDFGSAANFKIILVRPNAQDNWSGVTTVATQSAVSVPTGTWTELKFENVAVPIEVANGLGITVRCETGAISNKIIHVGEVTLEAGPVVTPFEPLHIGDTIRQCQRYYQKSYELEQAIGAGTTYGGIYIKMGAVSTAQFIYDVKFPVEMFKAPTIRVYDSAGNPDKVFRGGNNKNPDAFSATGTSGFVMSISDATSASEFFFQYTANAELV